MRRLPYTSYAAPRRGGQVVQTEASIGSHSGSIPDPAADADTDSPPPPYSLRWRSRSLSFIKDGGASIGWSTTGGSSPEYTYPNSSSSGSWPSGGGASAYTYGA